MDDALDKQIIEDVAEKIAEEDKLDLGALQLKANEVLKILDDYTKKAFNDKLSISSFKKIFQALKSSSSLEDNSATEIERKMKDAQKKINSEQLKEDRQNAIKEILSFQNLLNQTLGQKIVLTWIYKVDGKETVMTFNEVEEEKIISQSFGKSGKVSLNASSRTNVTGKKLEEYLIDLAKQTRKDGVMEKHIEKIQLLHQTIEKEKRLINVETQKNKKRKNQDGIKETVTTKTNPLFLWWKKSNNRRVYGYVNNYGFYYEGYVGALVDYKSAHFKSSLRLETQIRILYEKYISKADNLAGMWGGDIVSKFSTQNDKLNIQFAVKYLRASSQSFSLLYNFMVWISKRKDLTNFSKKSLYDTFYQESKGVGSGTVSSPLANVSDTVITKLKEDLQGTGIDVNNIDIQFSKKKKKSKT